MSEPRTDAETPSEGESFGWSDFPGDGSLIPKATPHASAQPGGRTSGMVANLPNELRQHPDYEVIAQLGQGAMGEVYLAEHRIARQRYVLKVINTHLRDDSDVKERFLREIRAAVSLGSHKNIAMAHPPLVLGALLVLVMEYVPGQDLDKVVRANGPLPVGNACYYATQAALGLQHAFSKKMVHRDVKPSNLILAVVDRKHVIKILDLGLAKVQRETSGTVYQKTVIGSMMGTPDYMAPEQADDAASADIRADIYSLGCTLYFLLTGRPPFQEASLARLIKAHERTAPTALQTVRPDVPVQLSALVAKMMAKSPAARFQTPEEVARALEPFGRTLKRLTVSAPLDSPGAAALSIFNSATIAIPVSAPVDNPGKVARPEPARRPAAVSDPNVAKPRAPVPPTLLERRPTAARRTPRRHGNGEGKGRGMFLVVLGLVAVVVLGVAVLGAAIVFRGKTADGSTNPGSGALFAAVTGKPSDTPKNPETRKDSPATDGETELAFTYVIDGVEKQGKCRLLTLDSGGGQKMDFVRVKAGSFLMGAPAGEKEASENEKPQHRVRITRDFYLGRTAVTQDQYEALMSKNPSSFKGRGLLPVENVSWKLADAYCTALSKRLGQKARLPWEAEWEFACRAGTTTPFHFGSKLNGDWANCDGNYPYGTEVKGNYYQATRPVGSYPANPWGLHDMHGNVWEWCGDYYGPYEGLYEENPKRVTMYNNKDLRVMRGGSWFNIAEFCRSATRDGIEPAHCNDGIGFRVCLPLD